ncbi:hypothetical protein DDB_G0270606 [Dictyostelium discoideum AX4]|uniref:UBX domain-containing protein n=1 Tax=Dictyostelium discoideum TaxID=44689 RepID=Q55DF7_DICDI|nr:hypothetical protein DDB_G0270606 [Dictyostelium discoideum AX4]EAL72653.1 hypothetical protein DDB_G0270606 [Dictyostelium discoideum AX4]|eukprot:XP_646174.1 hypothetical protein DDB_G0270606 [Dictyostelium discoideum AX4]
MVIMDHNTNISGSPTSSQVLSNGIQSIQSGISNRVQSIQSLPPQMYILKERIVNKNNYHIMDSNNNNNNVNSSNNSNNNNVGLKDYGEGGIYSFEDDSHRSASPSRLRSLSAPGSTSTTTAPATCTGTKNQRELFQQSIDSLASKYNNGNNNNLNNNNNNNNINNNNINNNNNNNNNINNNNNKDINSNNKSSLKNSGGSGSCGSDSEQLNCRIRDSTDEMYESEELANIDDEMIRMRSLSLTSFETFKKIEREKNIYSPSSTRDDDVLSPYEMMSHLEYQERLEREEMERMDKNNVIISQSSSDGYTGNQVQCESTLTSSSSIKSSLSSSSSLNISTSIPRISVSSSNSFSGSPSTCSISPPKSSSSSSKSKNSLTGSLNGTSVLIQQQQQQNHGGGNNSPITSITNSPSTRSSPLFKRSLTSNTTLSKSSTKLPSVEKEQQPTQQAPLSPQVQQQAQQLPPQVHAQLQAQIQQQQQQNIPKKVQPLVKSLSSQTILKEQQNKKQPIAAVASPSTTSSSLAQNRPSTPIQMSSSPNLNPLKKLTNKLSLSTHSLPQSPPPQTSSNTPTLTPKNKLVKCPSGNSILPNKKSISQSQQSQPVNNSFQLELKQHLKLKKEQNIINNNNNNNNNNIENNNNNNNIIENINNNNTLSRKERYELKKQNIPKPMDEPKGSSVVESIVKITFQFPSTGKKVNRYFNADCKVEELKNYIEWFAYQEPQLFDSSFKLSDDSHLKIVDYNIEYTILPTKFVISNFDVTFKDSGFVPKSNIINISLV